MNIYFNSSNYLHDHWRINMKSHALDEPETSCVASVTQSYQITYKHLRIKILFSPYCFVTFCYIY
jgi:hypothetical protein